MRRILSAVTLGFILASALIFVFGDSGVFAIRRLAQSRETLARNVARLEERNAELSVELESVRSNPERNTLMARSIGLYRPGDRVLKLDGGAVRREFYPVGDLVKLRRVKGRASAIIKASLLGITALLVGLSLYSTRAPRKRLHGRSRK
jgi:cell division protein FtsB